MFTKLKKGLKALGNVAVELIANLLYQGPR